MTFERLGQQLAREQDAMRARTLDLAEVRARLLALRPRSVSSVRSRRLLVAALGGALAAAAAFVLWPRPAGLQRDPAAGSLVAKLEGSEQPVAAGAFLEAPASAALAVRFSDRTRLQMSPGARGRLVELTATGAHVLLESGQAHVEVVPRARVRFRVSAGPFVVHVTGTRFDVRWDPEQDRFELDLARGHVEVSGCVFGQGYRMRAGQLVHASCKRGHFDVVERRASAQPTVPAEPAAATVREPSPAQASQARTRSAAPARARRGELEAKASVREDARGLSDTEFEQRCGQASREQLARLADEARYAGEFDHEAYALRLLRRRFAGTQPAALAAFALGRLEFDAHGGHRKAAEWFGTYLKEQPSGPLAREARGRLMEATFRAGDVSRARSLAQAYLSEYPQGPHAELARSLDTPVR